MKVVRVLWLLIVAAVIVTSCDKLKEKPVVDFASKDFKVESRAGCKLNDTIPCATFYVQYPVFLSLDTNVRRAISDRVNYILSGPMRETKSLEQIGNDFIKDFEQFVKDEPQYGMSWDYNANVEVMVASDTLISLRVEVESFTGGASASYSTNFVNVDPKTGTAYLLDALLRVGYEDELARLAEEELRDQLAVYEADSVVVPPFPEDGLKLNENYGFRKEGIVFCFDESEVPSVADGITELLIPYERLQDWIK